MITKQKQALRVFSLPRTCWLALVVATSGALPACSDTQAVRLGECGNHVLEEGEDCDGGPSCNASCHLDCDAKHPCPAGWGCDLQAEICKAPSGDWDRRTLPLGGTSQPLARDFDGDGRDELLLTSTALSQGAGALVYFDAGGQLERRVTLPSVTQATAADVTADGLPDLVLGGESVVAYQSQKSRVLTPLLSSVRELSDGAQLFAVDTNCDALRDFVLFEEQQLWSVDAAGEKKPLVETVISARTLGDLESASGVRGLHAAGSFEPDGFAECGLLALAASASSVAIYGPRSGNGELELLSTVRLDESSLGEGGQAQLSRLFLVDRNGDGFQDLLIAGTTTWVSYGVGDGTFHSDPGALPAPGSKKGDNVALPDVDFALSGLLAAGSDRGAPLLFGDRAGQYADARVLDLTGDGRSDVAAVANPGLGSSSTRSLDIVRFTTPNVSSALGLPTTGVPRLQDVADFDGDGHDELLLSEAPAADEPANLVSVLFSPVTSGEGPTPMAELSDIGQLAGGYLSTEFGTEDGIADIGVVYGNSEGSLQLGFLTGGADRLLRSEIPTRLGPDAMYAEHLAQLGRFRDAKSVQLALVTGASSVSVSGDGADGPRASVALFSIGLRGTRKLDTAGTQYPFAPHETTVADLDGDHVDELYVGTETGLFGLRFADNDFTAEAITQAPVISLLAVDANGDGEKDLVLSDPDAGQVLVVVAGESAAQRLHRFDVVALGCRGLPLGAAFIQADTDAEPELVVNCAELADTPGALAAANATLYFADVDWARDTLSKRKESPGIDSPYLVVGDFNGDGVEDLAGNAEQAVVLFGVPRP